MTPFRLPSIAARSSAPRASSLVGRYAPGARAASSRKYFGRRYRGNRGGSVSAKGGGGSEPFSSRTKSTRGSALMPFSPFSLYRNHRIGREVKRKVMNGGRAVSSSQGVLSCPPRPPMSGKQFKGGEGGCITQTCKTVSGKGRSRNFTPGRAQRRPGPPVSASSGRWKGEMIRNRFI
jgi:hypothetical protein